MHEALIAGINKNGMFSATQKSELISFLKEHASVIIPKKTVVSKRSMVKRIVLMNLPNSYFCEAKKVAMLIKTGTLLFSDLPQKRGNDANFYQERLNMFYAMQQFKIFVNRLLADQVMRLGSQSDELLRLITTAAVKRNVHGARFLSWFEIDRAAASLVDLVDAIEAIALDLVFAARVAEAIREGREDFSFHVEKDKAITDVARAVLTDAAITDAIYFSRRWHSTECRTAAEKLRDFSGKSWEGCLNVPYRREISPGCEVKKQTLKLVDLTSARALKEEGSALSHCVGANKTYRSQCKAGDIRILSVRDTAHPSKPLSTVEIKLHWGKPNKISLVQHRAQDNDRPNDRLVGFVEDFVQEANHPGADLINWSGIAKDKSERQKPAGALQKDVSEVVEFDPTKPGKMHKVKETYIPYLPTKGNIKNNLLALLPPSSLFLVHWEKPVIKDKVKAARAKSREAHFHKIYSIFCDAPSPGDAVLSQPRVRMRAGG